MQKTRSGLAAAAAEMQLTDAPEGKSSLQSRLDEAERRAQDAEASAQNARATLARTLLEAAQVEAVVTARIKAESEAEIEALRSELDAVKIAASTLESSLDKTWVKGDAQTRGADSTKSSPAADAEDLAPVMAPVDDGTVSVAHRPVTKNTSDLPGEGALPEIKADAPSIRMPDDDEPIDSVPEAAAAAEANALRYLPPLRLALLSVTAVVAVISYFIASSIMEDHGRRSVIAMHAPPAVTDKSVRSEPLVEGAAADKNAMAEASASLDAELMRLHALSRKVAELRAFLADRKAPDARAPANADRVIAADRASPGAGANWLLYMPVERDAVVQYLAGRNWPGMQIAAQNGNTAPRQN